MTLTLCLFAAIPALSRGGSVEVPKTIDEGMSRLEKLMGRYTEQHNVQWRFVYDDEIPLTPESGKRLVIVRKGIETYGVPVRSGDLITFDVILSLKRKIYDLPPSGERTLSRVIQNHSASRYYLRRSPSGDWFFEAAFLSHSIPEFRDRPFQCGRVNWLSNGIELIGLGTDNFFRQGGKLVTGAYLSRTKLLREENCMIEAVHSQAYELTSGPGGDVLPMPDFAKPIGEQFKSKLVSEKHRPSVGYP
jgi:hypothetical protein